MPFGREEMSIRDDFSARTNCPKLLKINTLLIKIPPLIVIVEEAGLGFIEIE